MTHPVFAAFSTDSNRTRRLLALAVIHDGGSRSEVAQVGGVGRQIVRDWVLRFNAEGPDGLLQRSGSGRPASEARLAALIARVETGPLPAIDGALATSGSGAVVMGGLSPQHQRKLPECHLAQTWIQETDSATASSWSERACD